MIAVVFHAKRAFDRALAGSGRRGSQPGQRQHGLLAVQSYPCPVPRSVRA